MTSPPIHIRAAVFGDSAGILKCLAAAFEPFQEEYTPGAFADTVLTDETLRLRFENMHILVACAADTDEIVGTISARVNESAGEAHLRGMAVLPECKGRGVAPLLLHEIENWLRSRGCKRVTLRTTPPLKAAMRFYEKKGYRRSGKITDLFEMPLIEYVKEL